MKKLTTILIAAALLTTIAAAQPTQNSSDPGILPGNAFYGFTQAAESLELAFASAPLIGGPKQKAKVLANHAEQRLAEARALASRNRSEKAAEVLERYQKTMNRSLKVARGLNDSKLDEKIENVTHKHLEVLQRVKQQVPEQAQKGIQRAINNAQKMARGLQRAREARENTQRRGNPANRPETPVERGKGGPGAPRMRNGTPNISAMPNATPGGRDSGSFNGSGSGKQTAPGKVGKRAVGNSSKQPEAASQRSAGQDASSEDRRPDSGSPTRGKPEQLPR